ncbi:hypothetical protein [Maribacter sp. 2304DJ31-5]|uniref:hypothetical protein n=1 Tax=Maribacter sp. 2304DJ31-5 TaxID=3386273 RepID=UPI0039BCC979
MKERSAMLFIILLVISCANKHIRDYKKITIIDFSKKRIDTLRPHEDKTYHAYFVKVNGETNDSIKIEREGHYNIILSGKIDTILNGDFYGAEDVIWVFNPYKATNGKLEIEYGL